MYPSNQQKMRYHLAEEVLDADVLHLMLQYQRCLGENGSVLNGAITFLRQTSNFLKNFKDMRPVKSINEPRLEELVSVAKWFDDWRKSTLADTPETITNKQKHIMSTQCHEDIQSCIIGFGQLCKMLLSGPCIIYVTPGLVNSNVIENTFNQQRSTYHGANSNPDAVQYRQALKNIILGQSSVVNSQCSKKSRGSCPL